MSAALIEVEGLAHRHPTLAPGERAVEVRLPSLRLGPGEVVALVGPSGCGKSTLLDCLGLVLSPSALGRFSLAEADGEAVEDLTPALLHGDLDALAEARRTRLGYVLQQGGLLPFLTVAENIAILGSPAGGTGVERLAADLGLETLLNRYPGTLSVGQRQRVSLARALHGAPRVLLADEPTAALDPPTAGEVLDLMLATARRRGLAIVIASHDWAALEERGIARMSARVGCEGDGLLVSRFSDREAA